jgi:sugar porter (SP) family MFS transporter
MLFFALLIGFFCQTMNGFDTMLFGGLLANKEYFLAHFHGENKGIWAGLITSMYQIGGACSLPFIGPAIDTFGRRIGMCIGSVLIVAGTVIQATTVANASEGQMMGGRFLTGFGVNIAAAAGPIWVVETTHPRYRGVTTGLCNTTWLLGAILSSGATRGGLDIKGNNSWVVPLWLQIVFPGLIIIGSFVIPESPRWLYTRGKTDKAIQELTKWHGFGNRDSIWVRLQLAEYEEHLELDGSDKRWWDYRPIFTKRSNFYRVMTACWFSAFTQWCGNSVLSYFMPAVLDTAGINSSVGKANVNLGYSVFQFVFAVAGAFFVEKFGRRKMMLSGFFGTAIVWICMTAAAGTLAASKVSGSVQDSDAVFSNHNASNAVLAFIFIFGAVYSFNITPLQSLYPVECINFNIRAKGMALQSFAVSAAGLMNQFAWPIAIKEIEWKTYIIFIVWNSIQGCIAYFVFPETRKRTVSLILNLGPRMQKTNKVFSWKNSTRSSKRRTPSNSRLPPTRLRSLRTRPLSLLMMMSRYNHLVCAWEMCC